MVKRRIRTESPAVQGRAKVLRREMTPAEIRLWRGLRGWKVGKFRRQHPVGEFILDFYDASARQCLEVDGGVHDEPEQRERDAARTQALAVLGIRVLRFSNQEVLTDTASVLRRIQWTLSALPPVASSPVSPLPFMGEGGDCKPPGEGRP